MGSTSGAPLDDSRPGRVGGSGAGVVFRGPVCLLATIVMAMIAGSSAGEAPRPEVRFARAVDVPIPRVLRVSEIQVDRAIVGIFGRYESDGAGFAVIVREPDGRVTRLGRADDAWFAGIVDLQADGSLTSQRRTPRRLTTAGMRRPALLLFTRHEEAIAPDPRTRSAASRAAGVRRETHLFLIELDGTMRILLDLETRHRSEDGFGGHDLGGLELRWRDGRTYLEGVRQDRLPASRARCLEPEPYPVRFELAADRWRDLSEAPPRVPCG